MAGHCVEGRGEAQADDGTHQEHEEHQGLVVRLGGAQEVYGDAYERYATWYKKQLCKLEALTENKEKEIVIEGHIKKDVFFSSIDVFFDVESENLKSIFVARPYF